MGMHSGERMAGCLVLRLDVALGTALFLPGVAYASFFSSAGAVSGAVAGASAAGAWS